MTPLLDRAATPADKPMLKRWGRASRSARAQPNMHLETPCIIRNIPTYDLLSKARLDKIEQAAGTILAEIGIEFREGPGTVELFYNAGCQIASVSGSSWNIKFEPGCALRPTHTVAA